MPTDDLEEKDFQNLGPLSAAPSNDADEVLMDLRVDFDDAIDISRERMVSIGTALIEKTGYQFTSDVNTTLLMAMFHAAGKPAPDSPLQKSVVVANADLAIMVIDIAKADGAGWWERQMLMRRMKKSLGTPE